MMFKISCAMALIATGASCTTSDDLSNELPPFTNGVSTLTGNAAPGDVDGIRGVARLWNPVSVAYGTDGRVYVNDFDNGKIRLVNADTGDTSTYVDQKHFYRPFAMAFGPDGALYATTDKNSTDSTQTPMTGSLWRIQGGVAKLVAENIGRPRGICVTTDGRVVLSDYQHHVVEVVTIANGAVDVIAGSWNSPTTFDIPYGMVWLDGKLVVADFEHNRIKLVGMDGSVAPFAGTGEAGYADGPVASAQFDHPQSLAVTSDGTIYVSDIGNYRIRRIKDGNVDTVAGSGEPGWLDSDDLLAAQFYGLEGIAVRPDGSFLYVADGTRGEDGVPYNYVRMIKLQ